MNNESVHDSGLASVMVLFVMLYPTIKRDVKILNYPSSSSSGISTISSGIKVRFS